MTLTKGVKKGCCGKIWGIRQYSPRLGEMQHIWEMLQVEQTAFMNWYT